LENLAEERHCILLDSLEEHLTKGVFILDDDILIAYINVSIPKELLA
jgi:hypothetical protein